MMQLSFGQIIQTVLQVLIKSKNPIMLFTIFLSLFVLISTEKIKLANKKKAMMGLGGILGIILIWQFGEPFISLLDQLMNQIVITLFFPSMAYYLIMILVTNYIAIQTWKKKPKLYIKRLNMAVFGIVNLSLLVTLYQVSKQNINIYSQVALYQNTEILALIEFSMIVFTFWIIALGIIACINKLTKEDTIEEVNKEEKTIVNVPVRRPVYQTTIEVEDSPIDYNAYLNTYPNRLFDNNESIVTIAQDQMKEQVVEKVKEKEFLTLEDYRNLLSLLKNLKDDSSSQNVKEYQSAEDMKLQEMLFNSLYFGKQF